MMKTGNSSPQTGNRKKNSIFFLFPLFLSFGLRSAVSVPLCPPADMAVSIADSGTTEKETAAGLPPEMLFP